MSQRVISFWAGQYLRGRPGLTENVDLPVFTILYPLYRCTVTISAWKTVHKGSSRSVEYPSLFRPAIASELHRLRPRFGFRRYKYAARPLRDGPKSESPRPRRSHTRSRTSAQGEASR
ncbi:hypothetical protein EVAR_35656_1 [Eumeta japonica]|uniref:Uncharacterized protein n=1 Tax=Eumeta variegata TaxID=151549 RepID=A0A4C1VF26_EUMVA|nr:hypothetical protein EVAR_35656_1 [Eumeta japonica]